MKNNLKNFLYLILAIIIIVIVGAFFYLLGLNRKENSSDKRIFNHNINLDTYDKDLVLKESGEYTLTGNFDHAILVKANGEVILHLNNVNIASSKQAAIANTTKNGLTIDLMPDTNNYLSDGGDSDYDGCLYSEGNLTINGSGSLYVYGRQEEGEGIATSDSDIIINGGNIFIEANDDGINAGGDNGGVITINDGRIYVNAFGDGIDSNNALTINGGLVYTAGSPFGGDAGIDTDNGFTINGGTVIALGMDMLELPTNSSLQNTVGFNLPNRISKGTMIALTDINDNLILGFEASEAFKTLIISSANLVNGSYYLYQNGNFTGEAVNGVYLNTTYNKGNVMPILGNAPFQVTSNITLIGNRQFR